MIFSFIFVTFSVFWSKCVDREHIAFLIPAFFQGSARSISGSSGVRTCNGWLRTMSKTYRYEQYLLARDWTSCDQISFVIF